MVATLAANASGAERVEYQLVTCHELATATYELDYLIDDILVARQPCIFAGGKKCLKTSLLIDLAIGLATGGKFLGRFDVRRAARVLVMSGESGMATIQETARRVAAAQGHSLRDIGGVMFSPQLPVFGQTAHHDALDAMLRENEIETLIIDPAYLAMPTGGSEGSLFAMGALLRGMTDVCQSAGVTLILAHHTRKNLSDAYGLPELEDISWAGFNEFARQWVLIGRRERFEPGTGEHRLWLNAGGSAGHSSCWALDVSEGVYHPDAPRHWRVSLMRPDEAQRHQKAAKDARREASSAAQLEADRKAVVAAIVKLPDCTGTKTEIKERANLSTSRINVAIASLASDGIMIECEITKGNNRQYAAWKLAGDNAENRIREQPENATGQPFPVAIASGTGRPYVVGRPSGSDANPPCGDASESAFPVATTLFTPITSKELPSRLDTLDARESYMSKLLGMGAN